VTLPRTPIIFQSGKTLYAQRLNRAFERMYRDVSDSMDRRYTHSTFKLDFTGLTSASTAEEFVFRIKAPFAWRVDFVELVAYPATVGSPTLVSLASSMTGFRTATVVPLTGTSRARGTETMNASAASNTEITFTLSVTAPGAYTLGRCYVVVHMTSDRGNAGTSYPKVSLGDAMRVGSGTFVEAGTINSKFTEIDTAANANKLAIKDQRIIVFSARNIPAAFPSSDADMRIPATSSKLNSYDVVNLGAVGNHISGRILSAARATLVATATANGSGSPPSKTQGTSLSHTQVSSDPGTPASDYFIQMTRAGAATIPLAYVVLYTI